MNITHETYEKSIIASCIQLAQAYSLNDKINIEQAKLKVSMFLQSLKEFKTENTVTKENNTEDIRTALSLAVKAADGNQAKAYYELLKLREKFH